MGVLLSYSNKSIVTIPFMPSQEVAAGDPIEEGSVSGVFATKKPGATKTTTTAPVHEATAASELTLCSCQGHEPVCPTI